MQVYRDVLRGLASTTVHIVSAAVDLCLLETRCVFESVDSSSLTAAVRQYTLLCLAVEDSLLVRNGGMFDNTWLAVEFVYLAVTCCCHVRFCEILRWWFS